MLIRICDRCGASGVDDKLGFPALTLNQVGEDKEFCKVCFEEYKKIFEQFTNERNAKIREWINAK